MLPGTRAQQGACSDAQALGVQVAHALFHLGVAVCRGFGQHQHNALSCQARMACQRHQLTAQRHGKRFQRAHGQRNEHSPLAAVFHKLGQHGVKSMAGEMVQAPHGAGDARQALVGAAQHSRRAAHGGDVARNHTLLKIRHRAKLGDQAVLIEQGLNFLRTDGTSHIA